MKNLLKFYGLILYSILLFTACKNNDNDEDDGVVSTPPTAAEFKSLINNALSSRTQSFEFKADTNGVFTSSNGVKVTINKDCLYLNDTTLVTDTVAVFFIELFDKANMLVTNKPTMGVDSVNKKMLTSGGEFFIQAKIGSAELTLDTNCISLEVPNSLTGGTQTGMSFWFGAEDANGNLAFTEAAAGDRGGEGNAAFENVNNNYNVTFSQFGWSNVDKFYSVTGSKTTILVDVPEGYDNDNSAVYLSYDGDDNGLANLDTYNPTSELFSEHYGQIPVGLPIHVIFASEDEGQWRYGIKPVTIVANDTITIDLDSTVVGTEAQLINAINALP